MFPLGDDCPACATLDSFAQVKRPFDIFPFRSLCLFQGQAEGILARALHPANGLQPCRSHLSLSSRANPLNICLTSLKKKKKSYTAASTSVNLLLSGLQSIQGIQIKSPWPLAWTNFETLLNQSGSQRL